MYRFVGSKRDKKTNVLWTEYVYGKQSYKQLAIKHKLSIKTVVKSIDNFKYSYPALVPGVVVLGLDTVFYGKLFGVCVFQDLLTKKNLLWYFCEKELLDTAITGIRELQAKGMVIMGIVCDGKNLNLKQVFPDIPFQMCQFHQLAITKRYLTNNPKLLASRQLKQITQMITQGNEAKFRFYLDAWYQHWREFLKERTYTQNNLNWS